MFASRGERRLSLAKRRRPACVRRLVTQAAMWRALSRARVYRQNARTATGGRRQRGGREASAKKMRLPPGSLLVGGREEAVPGRLRLAAICGNVCHDKTALPPSLLSNAARPSHKPPCFTRI